MFWGVFALGFHSPSQPSEAGDDLGTGPIVVGQLMAELERICADGSWIDSGCGPSAGGKKGALEEDVEEQDQH